ncbi:MAG TPA: SPFH domain-containing protein [Candidatus Saccharimonadales bacterium]|nr:SPFH domain-containing protein [Candidatus Saccharimonadales bacterium]
MNSHRRNIVRRFTVGAASLALVIGTAACTTVSTAPDQVALHYQAGSFTATKYSDCVRPSTKNYNGPGDLSYWYPTGQRTFDFTGGKDAESQPITVVSSDNQELQVSGLLTFNLDTSCEPNGGILRKFHENIGLKFQAYMDPDDTTSAGWDRMLRVYMGQPLRKMLNSAAQQYTWLALYNDPATRVKFEQEVNAQLADQIKATTGGTDYFQNFALTLQKPEPNPALVAALANVQVQVTNGKAIDQQNQNIAAALSGIKQLTSVLGPYGYILYQTLQNCMSGKEVSGCPTFLPVPTGANVNIPGLPSANK